MALIVTVALVGDPRFSDMPDFWQWDLHTPYYDRTKVELTVEEGDTLGDVLRRAAEDLLPETAWPEAFVDFYREGDGATVRRELFLLDEEGHVRSTWGWADEPMRELLRASEAGVLGGDARRPYLLNVPGHGNGILADWPTFAELLSIWWEIAKVVATTGGVWQFFKLVGEQIEKRGPQSAEVVETRAPEWKERGLRPDLLLDLLGTRPWHEADLANRLACTEDEAEALLTGLGFAPRDDGLWVPADDEGSRMLRGNIEVIVHGSMTTQTSAIEEELRRRVERLRETGRAEPVDWERIGRFPPDLSRLPPPLDDDEEIMTPREEVNFALGELRFGAGALARGLWRSARERRRKPPWGKV